MCVLITMIIIIIYVNVIARLAAHSNSVFVNSKYTYDKRGVGRRTEN